MYENLKIWMYWENKPGFETPFYIEFGQQLIKKFNPERNIIILDEKIVLDYIQIPDIIQAQEHIAHKADYIRVAILEKYGGIWIDSDVICLNSFEKHFELLEEYDIIAYEYTRLKRMSYSPSNWFLAVKPNNILFKTWRLKILEKIRHTSFIEVKNNAKKHWHFIGRQLLVPILRKLRRKKMIKYFGINCMATVNPIGWNNSDKWFNENDISTVLKPDVYQPFIILFNSETPRLKEITKEDLVNKQNLLIIKLMNYALSL